MVMTRDPKKEGGSRRKVTEETLRPRLPILTWNPTEVINPCEPMVIRVKVVGPCGPPNREAYVKWLAVGSLNDVVWNITTSLFARTVQGVVMVTDYGVASLDV